MKNPEKDFIVIFQGSALEANLVVGKLASAGLSSYLRDENMGTILPLSGMPTGFGSVKVVVAMKDEGAALKLLGTS